MSPLPLTEHRLLVDNSFLSCLTTCPRQAFYKYILRRQLVKPRAALFYGGAIHKALETRDRYQLPMVSLEIESAMIDTLITTYSGVDFESDYRNLDYAIETIRRYNTTWKFDQAVTDVKYIDNNPSEGSLITIESKGKMILPVIIKTGQI